MSTTSNTGNVLTLNNIEVTDKDIRQFVRLIFKHGYNLGAFSGDLNKVVQGYNLMMSEDWLKERDLPTEGMQVLLDITKS